MSLRRLLYLALLVAFSAPSPAHSSDSVASFALAAALDNDGELPLGHSVRCFLARYSNEPNVATKIPETPESCGFTSDVDSLTMEKSEFRDTRDGECGNDCELVESQWHIVVYFDDGSYFSYRVQEQILICDGEEWRSRNATMGTTGTCNDVSITVISGVYTEYANAVRTTLLRTGLALTPSAPATTYAVVPDQFRAIAGNEAIEMRAGAGAGLDLSNIVAPFPATTSTAVIYADSVITPGGMSLADMFDPDPIVLPSQSQEAVELLEARYPCRIGAGLDTLEVIVRNTGTEPLTVDVDYSDTNGWSGAGGTSVSIPFGEFARVNIPVTFPAPVACDSSVVTVTVSDGPSTLAEADYVVHAPIDDDGDGVVSACDNCWDTYNPGQEDADLNHIGDVCQAETIPTLSEWALILSMTLLLAIGATILRRRQEH